MLLLHKLYVRQAQGRIVIFTGGSPMSDRSVQDVNPGRAGMARAPEFAQANPARTERRIAQRQEALHSFRSSLPMRCAYGHALQISNYSSMAISAGHHAWAACPRCILWLHLDIVRPFSDTTLHQPPEHAEQGRGTRQLPELASTCTGCPSMCLWPSCLHACSQCCYARQACLYSCKCMACHKASIPCIC